MKAALPAFRKRLDGALVTAMAAMTVFLAAAAYRGHSGRSEGTTSETPGPLSDVPIALTEAMTKGCPEALIALLVFEDYQCDACRQLAAGALREVENRYVKTCTVLLAIRHLPIVARDSLALVKAEAVACAAAQDRGWQVRDAMFEQKDVGTADDVLERANQLTVDRPLFEDCVATRASLSQIRIDAGDGVLLGISATPTLVIGVIEPDRRVRAVRVIHSASGLPELSEVLSSAVKAHPPRHDENRALVPNRPK